MTIYKNFIKNNKTNKKDLLDNNIYKLPDLNNRLLESKIIDTNSKTASLNSGLKTSYKALNFELENLYKNNRIISDNNIELNDRLILEYNGISPSGDILLVSPKNKNKQEKFLDINSILNNLKDLKRIFLRKKTIKGVILRPVKGGFSVGIRGFIGFLPNSQLFKDRSLTLNQWKDKTSNLFGKELDLKIISLRPFKTFNNELKINIVLTTAQKPKNTSYFKELLKRNNSNYVMFRNNKSNNRLFGKIIHNNKFNSFIPIPNTKDKSLFKLAQVNLPDFAKDSHKLVMILVPIKK